MDVFDFLIHDNDGASNGATAYKNFSLIFHFEEDHLNNSVAFWV